MKIMFSGGGTGGSVMPLIAVYQKLAKIQPIKPLFFWVGGNRGVEKDILTNYNDIVYLPISSGKFRRYFDWQNFFDFFLVIRGFWQSLKILRRINPDVIVTAGSFISVPLVWAGALLRIPILVHQQDMVKGLANQLMGLWAKKITISWQESAKDFPRFKTVFTGNPIRQEIFAQDEKVINSFKEKYKVDNLPIILFLTGGTGAVAINKAIEKQLEKLINVANIFHITGSGKKIAVDNNLPNISRYHQLEFVGPELITMMLTATLIISRAGMSTLSELAVLGKPVIIVPMPGTHQEANAIIFYKNNAAVVFEQKFLLDDSFVNLINELLNNSAKLTNLSLNIKKMMPVDAAEKISNLVLELAS